MLYNTVIVAAEKGSQLPSKGTEQSIGMDIRATQNCILLAGATKLLSTGMRVAIPNNHAMLILPRSGLSKKGIIIPNSPGLIDPDYRGEVKVLLRNTTDFWHHITKGDRIAQAIVLPVPKVEWYLVDELPPTARGDGGFGSTGR